MDLDASTALALGIVSTLTPWFFSVHSKLASIAEQTAQGAKKIDEISAATLKTVEKFFAVERRLDDAANKIDVLDDRLREVETAVAE